MPIPVVSVRPIVGIQVPIGPVPVAITIGRVAVNTTSITPTTAISAARHWRLAAGWKTILRYRY